jgi:hypothetical protein
MAREGFLYHGTYPAIADEAPHVEVTFLPVVLRFDGSGCARLEVLIHPRITEDSAACCAPPKAPALWALYRQHGCKTVLSRRNNQVVIAIPGTYRVEVCAADLDTVIYWEESESLAGRPLFVVQP